MERLWAGWRSRYVRGVDDAAISAAGDLTLFERILAADVTDEQAQIVHRGPRVAVLMNLYPYCVGHLLVIPNRGVARLADLDSDESGELWTTINKAVAVVEAEYRPPGVNVGLNQGRAAGAGIPDHLHFHVLPRWEADTNFMTSVAGARVLPEAIDDTAERLRARWRDLG